MTSSASCRARPRSASASWRASWRLLRLFAGLRGVGLGRLLAQGGDLLVGLGPCAVGTLTGRREQLRALRLRGLGLPPQVLAGRHQQLLGLRGRLGPPSFGVLPGASGVRLGLHP